MVAVEVAEMETTIRLLREQVRDYERTIAALEAENNMLRERCEKSEESAVIELTRATQMKQTMTDMSAMLIAGLRKMESDVDEALRVRAEERAAKEARRAQQERDLEVGSGGLPVFLDQSPERVAGGPEHGEAEALGEVTETSSLDKLPPASFQPDIESDLERLAKLGSGGEPDKGESFR